MRFVVKIGTALATDTEHRLDVGFLRALVAQIAKIKERGHQIVLVSSGAVASGRSELNFEKEKKNIPYRQALAAVGQGILMKTYQDLFRKRGIVTAQALLTNYDFVNRENFLNTKRVFELLLQRGVVPVVNENDVTTIAELKFGDNDMLSAKTAAMISADALFILTSVDGLFTASPRENPDAELIPFVEKIDGRIRAAAQGAASKHSLGGMATKIEAAQYATSAGILMFIANGRKKGILEELVGFCERKRTGESPELPHATFFSASARHLEGSKKWLKPKLKALAWIEVDSGAKEAVLKKGKSLLPSGIVEVCGQFSRGDVILIKSAGEEIGYGQTNYSSEELGKIKGCHSNEIEPWLGYSFEEEVIHRDRMVISG